MIRTSVAVFAIALSATCSPKPDMLPYDMPRFDGGTSEDGGLPGPDCRPCEMWGQSEVLGPLPMPLEELSGLAASAAIPGIFYAHNDSGDSARLFALALNGTELAELTLSGATAVDWEDMALGPCDTFTCLYLADIGDNLQTRGNYVIYRAREPDLSAAINGVPEPLRLTLPFDRLPFLYPNGEHHNAETLLVHPKTGDIYIVTKEQGGRPSRVFQFPRPLTPDQSATLIDLGPASFPTQTDSLATGGDIHPCGDQLLIRMYNRNVVLRLPSPDAGFNSIFSAAPVEVTTPIDEPQGEAIVWGPDGQSYFSASENTGQSLHRVRCIRAP